MVFPFRKWCGAAWLTVRGEAARARRDLHRGGHGLRIAVLHDVPPATFDRFRRLLDHAIAHFDVVGPEAATELLEGRFTAVGRDKLLFTFDDGFASNHRAAETLAERGLRALFFVMPSFIDRSRAEWIAGHRQAGREAFAVWAGGDPRGLSRSQLGEMVAMGHVIGAHNDAHLDLGRLTDADTVRGEVDRAIDGVEALTGAVCRDFAIAFGRPRHCHPVALERLRQRGSRVYACVRGLNRPGLSPRLLLRDQIDPHDPWIFQRASLSGAVDRRWAGEAAELARLGGVVPE